MMDAQDKELDNIRRQWQELHIDNGRIDDTNRKLSARLASEHACTQQQKLSLRYRRMGLFGFVAMPLLAIVLYRMLLSPAWLASLYAAIGLCLAGLNFGFGQFVGKTDYIGMPVCEAMNHAQRVVLWQSRLRTAGIALALVVLIPLFAHFYTFDNKAVFYGGIAGLVIGTVVGLIDYNSKRKAAKRILDELATEPDSKQD